MHGLPVVGSANIDAALLAQRDALQYLHDQTLAAADALTPVDDIVNTVRLPDSLSAGLYTRPLAVDQAAIVRAVYHEHVGWFDGDVSHLETLSTVEKARRLIEFGGGENAVLSYVKKCLSEHTRNGAVEAVDKLNALRLIYPSALADAYYLQALKMLGWTTPNAPMRNWYLLKAQTVVLQP
jgi:alkyl sulfatase BDS1-like metallo-beta-lactamase superfamily hydrolase